MNDLDPQGAEVDFIFNSECAPGGVIVYYADGGEEIIHANQYVIDLFECDSFEDLMQLTGGSFRGFVHSEDIDSTEDSIWGQVEATDSLDHIYYRIKTKTGRLVSVEDFGKLVEIPGGRPLFHVFLIESSQHSTIDWLTGLPSMVRFQGLAAIGASAIRSRGQRPVAVALDLIGLKSFNVEYGRDEGDELLRVLGDIVRKHFGSEGCSRFGEDHFYAYGTDEGISERLQNLFEDFRFANGGKVLPIRAGAYICEEGDDIVAVGFDRAKLACDLDRKTWRSHVTWFTDEMRTQALLRIHMLDHVEQAMKDGQIRPYYQPIVRASTGRVCGEEALARWMDPKYGSLAPNLFIPVLEEAGLLQVFDMYMVDCVLRDLKAKQAHGVPAMPVSVNISLSDLGDLDIAAEITKRIDAAGLPHELLRVEFTESAASEDPELLRQQTRALRASGFQVWLDDFGSGYSSLNMLKDFDFDLIKLDMEFVRGIDNEASRKIVAGTVSVAAKLGVTTLAEGVETEEQAQFLESIGCNMLQGFLYSTPTPLEVIMGRFSRGVGLPREAVDELAYWNDLGKVDLIDPTSNVDMRAVDGTPLAQLPAGILEYRGETWTLVRANRAYREFLDKKGRIPLSASNLKAVPFKDGVDIEYSTAAFRSMTSGKWERVAGRLEYGTGLQFFTRAIVSTPDAQAFVLASVPTMLGTALGSFGDVPVAYAVLRAVFNEDRTEVVDAEYVFANTVYYDWCHFTSTNLTGLSFLKMAGEESNLWFPYCYRAAALGEEVRDVVFSPGVGHWLSFNMAPSPIEGCFVLAFTIADDEHREREEILMGRDTSDLIIEITHMFNTEESYEAAMNSVLERVSHAVHPERLYIFERSGATMSATFEWCAAGIASRLDHLQNMDSSDFATWDRIIEKRSAIIIRDIDDLIGVDDVLYQRLHRQGIERILGIPLRSGERQLGFIVADNYSVEKGIDARRLLETVASFISARIVNQRLVEELEDAGRRDGLTGLLNRRGIDRAVAQRLAANPGTPFVLALMDVDDFKTLNDVHGHGVGDELLRSLARHVVKTLPAGTIVGRNGGDEFLAMLFDEGAERADELFETLSNSRMGCEHGGIWYPASLSIGYVGCPAQAPDLKSAYSKADVALYAVKLSGKSSFRRYSPEIESQYRSLLGFSSRDLAEFIPGGIMVHTADDERRILFANEELRGMLKCDSLSDLMAFCRGSARNIVHPDDLKNVHAALSQQAVAGSAGTKGFNNYRLLTKNGTVINVAANSRLAEVDQIGKVFYVLLINRDERVKH